MPFDLESISTIVTIGVGILTALGVVFGWFGKVWRWGISFFKPKPPVGTIEIPSKTLILLPISRQNALWWQMVLMGDQPAMQINGALNATNISEYGIVVVGAKLRKPKAIGHVLVSSHDSYMCSSKQVIQKGAVSGLSFDFLIQPPVCKKNKSFKADVAIIDQFGNEHWLKGLVFQYLQ
jgi:hypothetical protein